VNDPRWLEWLRVSRAATDAPETERMLRLDEASRARAELCAAFDRDPARAPNPDLARQLREVEASIAAMAQQARDQLAAALEELRRVRAGAQGYRPEQSSAPSLISRSV
jgi:hypothetical protein